MFLEVFTRRMWSSIRRNGKSMGRDESGCDKNTFDLTQRYLMLQATTNDSLQHCIGQRDWCKISYHYIIIFRDMLWLYRSITKINVQLLQIAWVWCASWLQPQGTKWNFQSWLIYYILERTKKHSINLIIFKGAFNGSKR